MHIWKFAVFLLLAACAPSQVLNGSTVMIDGNRYFVREMPNEPGSWQAGSDEPSLENAFSISPARYAANIKAIESVSGCAVITSSVYQWDGTTFARVSC